MDKLMKTALDKFDESITDNDIAESMLSLSYKFQDQYYSQVKNQGYKAFLITLILAVLGFIITVAAVCGIIFFNIKEGGYVTAALGLITNFISGIFFYIYNKTSKDMKDYFSRILLSQNLAVSLILTKNLSEEQQGIEINKIIETILIDYSKNISKSDNKGADLSPTK